MKKILIIEDDIEVRSGLIDLLEESGFKVIPSSTGKEGLLLSKELLPDLIISDIMMPGLSGIDVIKELNSHTSTKLIPLIFLTAKKEMTDLREAMEYGAADYIVKPYDANDLLRAINVRIEKAEAYKSLIKKEMIKTDPKEKKKAARKHLYTERITLIVEGKPEFIKLSDIVCIEAENIYSTVYLNNGHNLLIRKSLRNWEQILPDSEFLRIHRSTIININFIDRIEKWYKRSLKIYLKNSHRSFIISQRYAAKIKSSVV
ncbi:MAG: LytR/AlgR family response regulator transcription factor [Clostridiales bacterium]